MKIVKKNIKGAYGMVDLTKKKIYVNPKKNKTKGELLDTIVHEKIHIKHQKMSEKLVRETTAKELARIDRKSVV